MDGGDLGELKWCEIFRLNSTLQCLALGIPVSGNKLCYPFLSVTLKDCWEHLFRDKLSDN